TSVIIASNTVSPFLKSIMGLFPQLLFLFIGSVFICGFLKVFQLYQNKKKLLKTFKSFPGPASHWFYGHSKQTVRAQELVKVLEWTEKYPYAFPRWFNGFMATLHISHPDYAKAVFNHGGKQFILFVSAGEGLLVLHGPKWFQHRRLLTPGFHYDILKPYVALIAESTKVMLDKWEKLLEKDTTKSLEMFEHVSLMTLDSIMKCAFGSQDLDNYIKAVYDLTYLISKRVRNIFYWNNLMFRCTSAGQRFLEACRLAHQHTEKVIEERKKVFKQEAELEKIQKKRYLDFLDILLCARDEHGMGLSDDDLRAEVDTFMFEGHDTTASGIAWILYAMAQNPEHQQRCREEIMEVLGDRDTIQHDLGKIPYTTMCVKESLRLYPPVPTVSRQLSKPITFCDGQFLKHKTQYCNLTAREVFDPTRFSPEKSPQRHSHAFVPFAAGPRNCIGQQFAMNEMKVALAQILLRFEIMPDPAKLPIPVPQIVLKSENGIHLLLKKRN
uniref:Uncharacterized protein n=1 Tax=Varanus komodoensis TaxID=61221 RepID=A0A8D2J2K3_VARKO